MSQLFSQDLPINMDKMTEFNDDAIFRLERIPQIPAEANDYVQMEISIELNLDLATINRSYYSLLDCLSDIGGLMSVILSTIAFLLIILNHQYLENYMVVSLFEIDGAEDKSKRIQPPKCSNIKDFFIDIIPR